MLLMGRTLLFYSLLITIIFSCLTCRIYAQGAPQGINYQAVVRDNNGNIIANKAIRVQFSITSTLGDTYTEQFSSVSTNKFGLFNLVIGQGSVLTGSFSAIQWGNASHSL